MPDPAPGTALERRRTSMAVAVMSDDEIRRSWRIAEALATSGAFPDAKSTALAFAKMLVGHDLGLSPTQALMGIHIVEGKPQVSATTLAAFIKQTPGYDYTVVEHDETVCTIRFKIDGRKVGDSQFTIEQAQAAGLVKDKSGWKKYPRNMLFARALSNGIKWYMPDATGGVAVYHEGEFGPGRPELTEGSGGEAKGIDLGPKVEAVIARATELGHAGLADRAAAEMALGGRSPEAAVAWVQEANDELDRFEPTEAEVVEPDIEVDPAEKIAEARRVAAKLGADAIDAENEGKPDEAEQLRQGAAELQAQADALEAERS